MSLPIVKWWLHRFREGDTFNENKLRLRRLCVILKDRLFMFLAKYPFAVAKSSRHTLISMRWLWRICWFASWDSDNFREDNSAFTLGSSEKKVHHPIKIASRFSQTMSSLWFQKSHNRRRVLISFRVSGSSTICICQESNHSFRPNRYRGLNSYDCCFLHQDAVTDSEHSTKGAAIQRELFRETNVIITIEREKPESPKKQGSRFHHSYGQFSMSWRPTNYCKLFSKRLNVLRNHFTEG
jgi:hypothetical protein